MRANSAIRSLFPFQQNNFLGGWQSTPSGTLFLPPLQQQQQQQKLHLSMRVNSAV